MLTCSLNTTFVTCQSAAATYRSLQSVPVARSTVVPPCRHGAATTGCGRTRPPRRRQSWRSVRPTCPTTCSSRACSCWPSTRTGRRRRRAGWPTSCAACCRSQPTSCSSRAGPGWSACCAARPWSMTQPPSSCADGCGSWRVWQLLERSGRRRVAAEGCGETKMGAEIVYTCW